MAATTSRHQDITPADDTWSRMEEASSPHPDFISLGSIDGPLTEGPPQATVPSLSKRKCIITGESTKRCTPWRTNSKEYPCDPPGLHEEMYDAFEYLKPRPSEIRMRSDVITRVTHIITNRWPHAQVHVFGSVCNNLFLPTGDIDLVVLGHWKKIPLFSLEEDFITADIAAEGSILVLDKTTVPIIKFIDKMTEVKVDISFNRGSGIESARMITYFIQEYPVLPKLVLVLKQFLTQRNLNEVFHGGISSYSLILLIVSFLQLHPRARASDADANLGVLLIEFFELYGRNFNYMKTGITVLDGGSYFAKDEVAKANPDDHSLLYIVDPSDHEEGNASRGCYGMWQVKQAFDQAFLKLNSLVLSRDNPTPKRGSLLEEIIQVPVEIDEYRNWVDSTWPAHPLSPQASGSPYYMHLGPLLAPQPFYPPVVPFQPPMAPNGDFSGYSNQYTPTAPTKSSTTQDSFTNDSDSS